jgi:uncharacterized membrane protein
MTAAHHSRKWAGPALVLAFGLAVFAASLVWGHPTDGIWALALSAVFAGALAVGGRSELVRSMRGDGDERIAHITNVTNLIVLNVAGLAAVAGAVVEQARGFHSGPWTLACVIGGGVYLAVFIVVRAVA